MTNRTTKSALCRILALVVIIAVAALSWLALSFVPQQSAQADEVEQGDVAVLAETPSHDSVFGANHANSRPFSFEDEEIVYVEHRPYGWADRYYWQSTTFHLTKDEVLTTELGTHSDSSGNFTLNICLHGHSLTYTKGRIFDICGSSTVLNIYDCGGTGAIDSGHGLYAFNNSTINLYGGTIKGADGYNGVTVSGGSVFNMYGGSVRDNNGISTTDTGGVYIGSGGIFNMYGGIITNNTNKSHYGGAGVYASGVDSVFHMYGGSITNNIVDCAKADNDEDTLNKFYRGAGVYVNGTFTLEGNVNISGNIRKNGDDLTASNVEVYYQVNSDGSPRTDYYGNILYDGKIKITGPIGAGSQIGFTMQYDHLTGVITSGYTESGNTQNPSTFFNCDNSGYSISFDADLGTEAAVYEGEVDVGSYTIVSATAMSHVGTPKVGDTSIGLNIDVLLEKDDDHTPKTIHDTKTVTLSSPLHVGSNTITYNYVYKGVTKVVTYSITLDKVNAAVNWTCAGANSLTTNTAEIYADGSDLLSGISASYLGYDNQTVTVSGTSLVVKKNGATVNSVTDVGVYTITLPASETYDYSNGTFTLTVKQAPVDEGYYKMHSATAVVNGTYTAGATKVNVTVTATLKNTVNINDVTTATETKQITVSALKAGDNEVKFTYIYTDEKGGTQTAEVTVNVTASKKSAAVQWYFNGTLASNNTAQYTSNGIDVKGYISAKYTGLNGQTVTATDLDMIVKDGTGATVDSVIGAGTYTVTLSEKADYQFTNNSFTLTVNEANIEDGYYRMTAAVATGVVGVATVGDREITVTVKVSLEHTKNHDTTENTVNTKVTLATPLHVGNNTISFTYTHTSTPDDVQTSTVSLVVNAAKKQVTVTWYYDGVLISGNFISRLYDGTDVSGRIVAKYDGYDGELKSIDGTSASMLKKDANNNGNPVASLDAVGIYKLSLAESADYVFKNNIFTYVVAQNLGDISDFTYEEEDDVILGVSCDNALEHGTEMVVEWVEDLDDSLVSGQISSALNVSFVNNAVEVTPTGTITVRVLIPDELKGKDYKIYNLKDGVATELRFSADGDYATFTSDELNTILFVTQESPNPIPTPTPTPTPDGNGTGIVLNNNGMVWVWVSVAIIAAALAIMSIVIVVLSKRRKK